jgi:hypothetical protein
MNEACEIRLATPEDVPALVSILENVALWTSSNGLEAWDLGLFAEPDSAGQGWLREDIRNDTAYIICCDAVAVGTFVLRSRDELFWPNAGDDALYLHRFAVLKSVAGIGRQAIGWMIAEATRQTRTYLRLDCHAQNQRIRRYYAEAGFSHRGDVAIDGRPYSLYELAVDHTRLRRDPDL